MTLAIAGNERRHTFTDPAAGSWRAPVMMRIEVRQLVREER